MKRWAGLASRTVRHAVLIVITLALPSGAGLAQGTRAQRTACAGDVWRLCSSAIPSVDRIVACLKRERARLSPGCQTVFNDAEAKATINRPPAAGPGKATPHTQPEQAASTPPAVPAPGGGSAAAARPNIVARSLPAAAPEKVAGPGNATPYAPPEQAASTPAPAPPDGGPGAAERPNIVARSLPAAAPEEVASAKPPEPSGVARMAAQTEHVESRDIDSMTPVSSRRGRQQRDAYHQSSHRGRSGNRNGGIMEEIAPLVAMAMDGHSGRGNFDVGQMIGMARSMGFDPSTFMGGGGGGNWR